MNDVMHMWHINDSLMKSSTTYSFNKKLISRCGSKKVLAVGA